MTPLPRRALTGLVAVLLGVALVGGVAWAYWTTTATAGSSGASAAASVNPVPTPGASVSGRTVTVGWTAATLSNGVAVDGYLVRRYDAATLTAPTIGPGCTGTVVTSGCTETAVPAGQWVYTVTPVLGTNWRGPESVRSAPVVVAGPVLSLPARARPGTSVSGTVAGFLPGDTLRFRVGSPTGTELVGTVGGVPTPAPVPAGGGGGVGVTIPAGTSDGPRVVYAVGSPSSDAAAAEVVVDGTPPAAPVLTRTPGSTSGDRAVFGFAEPEPGATLECRMDGAAWEPCDTLEEFTGLSRGSHTFQARAVDTVGNVSPVTSFTWTVDLSIPTVEIAFPADSGSYNDSGFLAGCGTSAIGDACGSAEDDGTINRVETSLRQNSTGFYWNGLLFAPILQLWLPANGTEDWTWGIDPAVLPEGEYTLVARATDSLILGNFGYDTTTFTIDRTPPPAPTLTVAPPPTSGPALTIEFTTADPTAGFECRLDAGTWAPCASPQRWTDLIGGTHTVAVRAADPAGNVSAATSRTWTVDATAPSGQLTFPAPGQYNRAAWDAGCSTPTGDICGTASDAGGVAGVSVSIRRAATQSYWDGASFGAATETWLAATGGASWAYAFTGDRFPADGAYTVRWRVTDTVGNATHGETTIAIDTTPPSAPTIVQAPRDPSGPSVQFDFTEPEPGAALQCRLDSGAWTPCTAPADYEGLSAGAHVFAVRAIDAAGNVGASASHAWTVAAGIPSISITGPAGGRTYTDSGYTAACGTPTGDICGTASDSVGDAHPGRDQHPPRVHAALLGRRELRERHADVSARDRHQLVVLPGDSRRLPR